MVYFKRKSNTIFREYDSFGYITDNRNFGYKPVNDTVNYIGDKIISQSGAIFLSVLGREPQSLDDLAKLINEHFCDVDIDVIKADANGFYSLLVSEGFLVSGESRQECIEKDKAFSYRTAVSTNKEHSSPKVLEQTSQDFFDEYFNHEPQLQYLHIELTNRCNERCVHCYIPDEDRTHNINSTLLYSILEQCKSIRLLHLTISGGEPMLHPEFINFLRKSNEYNFSLSILSNLTMMNDSILEEMIKNPLLGVQVSLYSMNAAVHDSITQMKGSFEKTISGILTLIENDIPMQISCPIMKQNMDSYIAVENWGREHGISVGSDHNIIARYNHTTGNLCNRLTLNDVIEIIDHKVANSTQYIDQLRDTAATKKDLSADDYVCSVCHSSICITERGLAYPCAGWQDFVLGDTTKESLVDIWKHSKKAQYLRNLRRKDFPKCMQCSSKEYCTMCMVRNANEDPLGNPLTVNEYFCSIAKLNKSLALGE